MDSDDTIEETALALRNQFGMASAELLPGDDDVRRQALRNLLAKRIGEMIDHEFHNFVNTLYRMDIDEAKVKQALAKQPFSQALDEVAEMIIQRQIRKIITRKQYSSPTHDLEFDI